MSTTVRGRWTPIQATGDIPTGRSSSVASVVDNTLYVFSGEHEPRMPVDGDVFALDLSSCEWKRVSERPDQWPLARVGHAATVCAGQWYMYGGRIGADMGDQTLGDLWSYNPKESKTNHWSTLSIQGSPPPPLSYHSMASDGTDTIYVFGGCTVSHGRTNDIWCFSLSKQQWEQETFSGEHSKKAHPCARGGASAVWASDGLHVLFGYNGKEELADHWRWDHERRGWDAITSDGDQPPARSVTDVVHLPNIGSKGSLFVFGGEFTPSAKGHEGAGSYHSDSWLFDLDTGKWSKVDCGDAASVPSARGWFNSCAMPDGKTVIVFGGFDGKDRVNDAHIWTLEQ